MLPPVIIFDERVAYGYLQNIADQIDQPMVEADLHLIGTEVLYTPGQTGRVLDVDKTLAALQEQLKTFQDGEITLSMMEQTPTILDASAQAESLQQSFERSADAADCRQPGR